MTNQNLIVSNCSQCVHFKDGPAHPSFSKVCSKEGVQEYRIAPIHCFEASPIQVVRANVDLEAVGVNLRKLTPGQMVVMGHMLIQATALAEHNLKFGQPVYVNLGPEDVLANYFKGHAVGMASVKTSDGRVPHVYIAATLDFEDSAPELRTLLRLMPDSVLTTKEFRAKRDLLVKAGKLAATNVPDSEHLRNLPQWIAAGLPLPPKEEILAYDPPTLDTASIDWLDPFSVTEMESLRGMKDEPKSKTKGISLDAAAIAKREQRAAKILKESNMVVTYVTEENGTITKQVSEAFPEFDADEENAEPELDVTLMRWATPDVNRARPWNTDKESWTN